MIIKFAQKLVAVVFMLLTTQSAFTAKWSDYGAYSISWYDKAQTDFYISTASELAGVAYLVNNNFTSFSGKTIHLSNDIDLQGKEWNPIGSSNTYFAGSFDGNGYKISNVSIESPNDYYGGLWGKIKNAKVYNLYLTAYINIDIPYIGAVAADATNTTFDDVTVSSSIVYNKQKVDVSTSTKLEQRIGGVVGKSSYCEYRNVKAHTFVTYVFGSSTGSNCYGQVYLSLGGIVGYGDTNVYEKCQTENLFDVTIYGFETSNAYSDIEVDVNCGGIVGDDANLKTKIVSCLAVTRYFRGGHYKGNRDTTWFMFGGIGCSVYGTLQNCVAITQNYSIAGHDYSWVESWYHTNSTYGGVVAGRTPKTFGGCYSNNDVEKTISKVLLDHEGENGSTSFSESQMNSQIFVDELNMYSQLMFDAKCWGLDSYGKLTLLTNDLSAIDEIVTGKKNDCIGIYDLQGRKQNSIKKGALNIIRYSDGTSQTMYVK